MNVFPFSTYDDPVSAGKELSVFTEYAYDYHHNRLMTKAGRPYLVYKDEAIKIWIDLALHTERYRWPAFSWAYGQELDQDIGMVWTEAGQSEIRRHIVEALMVNPYIQELSNFNFAKSKVTFDVTTIYGRFTYESEVYNE